MLTVFGSVALDTIRTPTRTLKCVLGGAATFASVSASFFVKTGLIAAVGRDFGLSHQRALSKHVNLDGLAVKSGKTFHYDGRYDSTLSTRETLKTELNVLDGFKPSVPERYKKSKFVYLANNDPEQNTALLKEFDNVKFSMCDTIDFWISTKRNAVKKMIGSVNAVAINDEEARLLTKEHNLTKCAKKIMSWGAAHVVIKKGEHGALIFDNDGVFSLSGIALEHVVDPTGAGDSFAGAMMGYLAAKNSCNISSIKSAAVHGNVMGSFAVEKYGLDGLLRLKKSDITKRVRAYERMTKF